MHIIVLLFAIGILLYNLIASFSNLSNVIRYSLDTNTLDEYWPYVFKNCLSLRAIFSGIFVLILCVLIFIVLVPVVLIRQVLFKSKVEKAVLEGDIFDYSKSRAHADVPLEFYTNIQDFGLSANDVQLTANIENDYYSVIDSLSKECKEKNLEFRYVVNFENYMIEIDRSQYIPLMLHVNDEPLPSWFIYNEFQKQQFFKARQTVSETKFRNCVYFSTVKMN